MTPDPLFDDETIADPHPYYATLRTDDPVHEVEGTGVFLVTRMDLIKEIVADPQTFSNRYVGFLNRDDGDGHPYVLPISSSDPSDESPGRWVLANADPPEHTRHRHALQPHFAPSAIDALDPTMRANARDLLVTREHADRLEAMGEFAEPLPMRVVAHMLGMPETAVPRMLEFSYASGERIGGVATRARIEELDRIASGQAGAFVLDAYARGESNRDSMVGGIVASVERGEIDVVEAGSMLANVVIAGGETTTSLLGTALLLLASRPELQRRLRGDAALIPAFIEEALRFDPPFRNLYRVATKDTELAGVAIPQGAHLALMWPAANRDPRAFDDPDDIVLDRPSLRSHVAFGWGVHLCIGAPLARAEARFALEAFFDDTSWFEIDADAEPPEYVPNLLMRRLRNLPLRITAR